MKIHGLFIIGLLRYFRFTDAYTVTRRHYRSTNNSKTNSFACNWSVVDERPASFFGFSVYFGPLTSFLLA